MEFESERERTLSLPTAQGRRTLDPFPTVHAECLVHENGERDAHMRKKNTHLLAR